MFACYLLSKSMIQNTGKVRMYVYTVDALALNSKLWIQTLKKGICRRWNEEILERCSSISVPVMVKKNR